MEHVAPTTKPRRNGIITGRAVRELLSDLISLPSPSREEARAVRYLCAWFRRFGQRVDVQTVSRNRHNVIVSTDLGNTTRVLLNTHIDTVPAERREQLTPTVRSGWMYGRGACDAKGSVAAMSLAFLALAQEPDRVSVDVTLAVMVGAEDSGDGVARFVKGRRAQFACAVVGEPTGLAIALRQSGYLEFGIVAESLACHAFDPIGDQAIVGLARVVVNLESIVQKTYPKSVKLFVRWINGGGPDEFWRTRQRCEVRIMVNPESDRDMLDFEARLRAEVGRAKLENTGIRFRVTKTDWDSGITARRRCLGAKLLTKGLKSQNLRVEFSHLPSWTDGSTLFSVGVPTVVFGPGRLRDAHTRHERVSLAEVRQAAIAIVEGVRGLRGL
jgi:acetylornithine deacetylase/succinyl-diaminopimelate desuccinylase-like protein